MDLGSTKSHLPEAHTCSVQCKSGMFQLSLGHEHEDPGIEDKAG